MKLANNLHNSFLKKPRCFIFIICMHFIRIPNSTSFYPLYNWCWHVRVDMIYIIHSWIDMIYYSYSARKTRVSFVLQKSLLWPGTLIFIHRCIHLLVLETVTLSLSYYKNYNSFIFRWTWVIRNEIRNTFTKCIRMYFERPSF